MKRILITGAGSYVGVSVETYLRQWTECYQVESLDMIGDGWREKSFEGFDTVFHVAAIVHRRENKNDSAQAELYDRVNHRLAVEVAQKAKTEGVKHFVFMSSESVYGVASAIGRKTVITKDTPLNPVDNYGISKKRAEDGLRDLASDEFRIAILRPPMIYGKGCKGNYQVLAGLARRLPVFPWVENQRSMLYIENFTEFFRLIVEDAASGIFCPQDDEYVNTSDMVAQIAHANGRNLLMVKGFTWALKLLRPVTGLADKAFGSLYYDKTLSEYTRNYCVKTLSEAIFATESK